MTAGVIAALTAVPVRVTDGMTAIFPQIIVTTLVIMADQVADRTADQIAVQIAVRTAFGQRIREWFRQFLIRFRRIVSIGRRIGRRRVTLEDERG